MRAELRIATVGEPDGGYRAAAKRSYATLTLRASSRPLDSAGHGVEASLGFLLFYLPIAGLLAESLGVRAAPSMAAAIGLAAALGLGGRQLGWSGLGAPRRVWVASDRFTIEAQEDGVATPETASHDVFEIVHLHAAPSATDTEQRDVVNDTVETSDRLLVSLPPPADADHFVRALRAHLEP